MYKKGSILLWEWETTPDPPSLLDPESAQEENANGDGARAGNGKRGKRKKVLKTVHEDLIPDSFWSPSTTRISILDS